MTGTAPEAMIARPVPPTVLPSVWTDRVCIALFAIISLSYFRDALTIGARSPLWMDEVLAVWTARQPDVPAVWAALRRGSEFTPPLYDVFLHFWIKAGASSVLMLRVPSIIAGYLVALAIGALVRRHAGWPLAALAAGAMLTGSLFDFAVQVRPYVFVTAAFGWALVIWDRLPHDGRIGWRKLAPLGLLLTIMIALHFYAVLLVATLGLAEVACRAWLRRLPRVAVLATVAISAATLACWWPIAQAASHYSRLDAFAPAYYGKPVLAHLGAFYVVLAGLPGVFAMVAGVAVPFARRKPVRDIPLALLALVLCAIPALVYGFALVVSHSYAIRYVVSGTFGFVLVLVWLLRQSAHAEALWAATILMIMAMFSQDHGHVEITRQDRLDVIALARTVPGTEPIAVGNGLRWFELVANLPPPLARRFVYLDVPDIVSSDPTNMHQVERWKAIDPALHVVDARQFVCTTPHFVLLADGGDELAGWLQDRARFAMPPQDRAALTPVTSLPCGPARP